MTPRGRRLALPLALAALVGAGAWLLAIRGVERPASAGSRPVILLMLDTLRADHLGFFGYERDTSPRLDAFARESLAQGDDMGGTGRYVEARNDIDGYAYYLVTDADHMYFDWGVEFQWRDWLGFFVPDSQESSVVSPATFDPARLEPPFTVLASRKAWEEFDDRFNAIWGDDATTFEITPTGRNLLAIEVMERSD